MDAGTSVLVQAKRDPVTSGCALLTPKPTMCCTCSNLSTSHSSASLSKPHLALLKQGAHSPTLGMSPQNSHKGCHQVPTLLLQSIPKPFGKPLVSAKTGV